MLRVGNPVPYFFDRNGDALDDGNVYVGIAGQDPAINPIQVYWDAAGTIPADQPLKTLGGTVVNGAIPAFFYVNATDYSQRVTDPFNVQISYAASRVDDTANYQPLDSDLTAIAALSTTAFGRSLLTLANQAALVTAVGLPAALPLAGGTMTGDISHQGGGDYTYWNDAGMTSGRLFLTAAGAADPTSQPGDVWYTF